MTLTHKMGGCRTQYIGANLVSAMSAYQDDVDFLLIGNVEYHIHQGPLSGQDTVRNIVFLDIPQLAFQRFLPIRRGTIPLSDQDDDFLPQGSKGVDTKLESPFRCCADKILSLRLNVPAMTIGIKTKSAVNICIILLKAKMFHSWDRKF